MSSAVLRRIKLAEQGQSAAPNMCTVIAYSWGASSMLPLHQRNLSESLPSGRTFTGGLCTKIIAVGHKLLFNWWLLKEPFCFVDFTNEVFSHRLLRCQFQNRLPLPYHQRTDRFAYCLFAYV